MFQDFARVRCVHCGWTGRAFLLSAQACPECDGRVAEEGSPEYEAAKYRPVTAESVARARAAQRLERADLERQTGLKIADDGTILKA